MQSVTPEQQSDQKEYKKIEYDDLIELKKKRVKEFKFRQEETEKAKREANVTEIVNSAMKQFDIWINNPNNFEDNITLHTTKNYTLSEISLAYQLIQLKIGYKCKVKYSGDSRRYEISIQLVL